VHERTGKCSLLVFSLPVGHDVIMVKEAGRARGPARKSCLTRPRVCWHEDPVARR